jgi:hypothetical protein
MIRKGGTRETNGKHLDPSLSQKLYHVIIALLIDLLP